MANSLSPELLAQLFSQESNDPFLTLVTLTHPSFAGPIYLVNNSENIISRGMEFLSFPMRISLPMDDGESNREVAIDFDNVSLEIIGELRKVTDYIDVSMEMVLASIPDEVQMELKELKIGNITYNPSKVSAKLFMDSFLYSALTSETYSPSNFPGLF